jgi:hypothetical protein
MDAVRLCLPWMGEPAAFMDTSSGQIAGLIPNDLSGEAPLESVPSGEAEAIRTIVAGIEARVRSAAAPGIPARRDAHPKAHGTVEAEFRVLSDLPEALRVGLFAEPRSFRAWIRFSSGSGTPQSDRIGDGRGMAVKVVGVAASPSGTQDFVMIDNPVFFVRNAMDYIDFQAAANPIRFFFPGWNPFRFRLHELWIATAITRRIVSNPLDCRYWSMTPYLHGASPAKFSAVPVDADGLPHDRDRDDFLRANLARALAGQDAAFDFCVQLRTNATMPVEDPTVEWREDRAPFVAVARITIPRQVCDTPERDMFGENLSFTPWHGLPEHRPLGGINRVRRIVYEAVSNLRHRLNHVARSEPEPS